MGRHSLRVLLVIAVACCLWRSSDGWASDVSASVEAAAVETVRLCVFNIEDLRAAEIEDPASDRLRAVAEAVAAIRPDVLLINELEFAGGWGEADGPEPAVDTAGLLAARLAVELSGLGVDDLSYTGYAWASNTGVPSGMDFDRNGVTGAPLHTREYGGDCYGYGEFPGQYAMGLLVREGFEVVRGDVRMFATLRWSSMPDALLPMGDGDRVPVDEPWLTEAMASEFRLSSKSHWDVPIRTPGGVVVHVLASHPTPPVFDGPEDRNGRRNHDEIRFWAEYVGYGASEDRSWIVDDAGGVGGLERGAKVVLMGDLNADPIVRPGEAGKLNPAQRWLVDSGAFNTTVTPQSLHAAAGERGDVTAAWGRRVDYVLPGATLPIARAAVFRGWLDAAPGGRVGSGAYQVPSDHYPVWVDVVVRPE